MLAALREHPLSQSSPSPPRPRCRSQDHPPLRSAGPAPGHQAAQVRAQPHPAARVELAPPAEGQAAGRSSGLEDLQEGCSPGALSNRAAQPFLPESPLTGQSHRHCSRTCPGCSHPTGCLADCASRGGLWPLRAPISRDGPCSALGTGWGVDRSLPGEPWRAQTPGSLTGGPWAANTWFGGFQGTG